MFLSSSQAQPEEFPQGSIVSANNQTETIVIDVSGAVVTPGVYVLMGKPRLEDAIKAAEGFRADANRGYISKYINLAQELVDGTKIYIPFESEQGFTQSQPVVMGTQTRGSSKTVNLNTASQAELESLPGIGPVTASKIISNRPYKSSDDLMTKKIMGKSTFMKIKDVLSTY